MEFKHSEVVDPSTYHTEGLHDEFVLRRHTDTKKEVQGALRAQEDWSKLVRPVFNYHGGLGNDYNWLCVTIPECLPERMEIVSYANEFVFLYDDAMENIIDYNQNTNDRHGFLAVFGEETLSTQIDKRTRGEKKILAQILREMSLIDPKRATVTIQAWASFVQRCSARVRTDSIASFEEYLPYRLIDIGELYWFGSLTFAMAITIPEEFWFVSALVRPAFHAFGLTNDLYSWGKERDDARKTGAKHVVNAIWVIMGERSTTEEEAKNICRQKIREYVLKFNDHVQVIKANLELSEGLRTYVEALQYSLSGNAVWSIYCPRYRV